MAAGDVIILDESNKGRKANIFDGTDDYVLHDAHAVARVAANDTVGTYTAWIYANTLASSRILSAGDNDTANEYFFIGIDASGKLYTSLKQGGAVQFSITQDTVNISARTWTHVAVVQNGTAPALYVNGSLVASTPSVSTDLTMWYDELTGCDKFAIGVLESNATHTGDWTGAIGRVKYFNIVLDAKEIMTEFKGESHTTNSGAPRAAVIETARVFDVSMEDDGTDDTGSGDDNGTLTGNAHYGGYVSPWSLRLEANSSGHAAEFINSISYAPGKMLSVIKRGD